MFRLATPLALAAALLAHQEVYNDNEISKGIRPQLKAFHLETEPWTYLIGAEGVTKDRLEGAYGVAELEAAMKTIVPG